MSKHGTPRHAVVEGNTATAEVPAGTYGAALDAAVAHEWGRAMREQYDRRERIATAVLAGFAASDAPLGKANFAALQAVRWADALIEALDRESPAK